MVQGQDGQHVVFYTNQLVRAGEELCIDYGPQYKGYFEVLFLNWFLMCEFELSESCWSGCLFAKTNRYYQAIAGVTLKNSDLYCCNSLSLTVF